MVLTGTGAPAGSTLAADGKTLTVPGEGVWTVDATTGEITFTPDAGFAGDPTAAPYTVADNDGNTSNAANVSIAFGDAPVAADDPVTSATIAPVTVNPLANDTDADGTLDPTTVVLTGTGAPAGSTLAADGKTLTVPGEGVWTVDATTGEITFTPDAGFAGDPTAAPYTVADNDGNTSNPATVSVDYGDAPVATDDVVSASGPGPVSIDPLANDTGANLDPASVVLTGTGAPAGSTLSADGKTLTVPGEGAWTVDPATGVVTFTPAAGFSGTPTPVAYTVSDEFGNVSNEATLSVTVAPALELVANPDGPLPLDGTNGSTSSISVLSNDTLDGDPITDPSLVILTPVSIPSPATGSITINPDGTATVAPGTSPGTYTLVYEICEVANPTNCATAQVELVVVDVGAGLIAEIEDDLENILEEDLANTLTIQSQQISSYSADALDRLQSRSHDQCLADVNARLEAENILFDVDQAVINPESRRTLDEMAAILLSCAGSAFEIAGHTDSDASDAYNLDLSQRRVTAVLAALADRGVDTTGYVARGYGESQPIASNATAAGRAQNRRVEFRPLDGIDSFQGPCDDSFSLVRALDARANDQGATVNGQFVRDQHDCSTDSREVFEGSLSYLDTETGQTQSAINLSYRHERYRGRDSVFGYFVGLYSSRSDVTRLANGEIRGVGVNAGVYGANRLQNELFVDYYLGAAAGRHRFDLAFDRSIGTIDATGDYQYVAGFAGAALSGQLELGDTTLTPRIGFDYVYTPGADVDVVAELSGLREVRNLNLDAISGGRIFAEIRSDYEFRDGQANLWFNPRIACYQSLGALDGACGFGGSIGLESLEQNNGLTYAFELDGEWGEDYSRGSLSLSASRALDFGIIGGDAGIDANGNATVSGQFEIQF